MGHGPSRHRYSPRTRERDGKWRRIKVKVNPSDAHAKLHLHAIKGYYGPTEQAIRAISANSAVNCLLELLSSLRFFPGQACRILMGAFPERPSQAARQPDTGLAISVPQAIRRSQRLLPAILPLRVEKIDLVRLPFKR